jgi:hypothetical protein
MIEKTREKEKAIKLRKQGFSYSEILKEVPVAKSTLSLWLRSVGLAKKQKQRLAEKKLAAMKRGWEACQKKRLDITRAIKNKAKKEIGILSNRDLWLIGIALYWAEGAKERIKSSNLQFGNSDPRMIKLYLKWLRKTYKIPKKDIFFEIYLHKTATKREREVKRYWMDVTGSPITQFQKIRWKKHNLSPKRKNIGKDYYGQLRVSTRKSVDKNRKIAGWIEGICKIIKN